MFSLRQELGFYIDSNADERQPSKGSFYCRDSIQKISNIL